MKALTFLIATDLRKAKLKYTGPDVDALSKRLPAAPERV